jgi:uncharacterized protein
MNPETLLAKYFPPLALAIILEHSRNVARKALEIAANSPMAQQLDTVFIAEAALLHDIGVALTDAPGLGCHGTEPYIRHGILGRAILEREGLPRHALVCERHIGVGLTIADIRQQNLPLPLRDMIPETPEERVVAAADLFYSKKKNALSAEKSVDRIRSDLGKFGADKVAVFEGWLQEFSIDAHGGDESFQ